MMFSLNEYSHNEAFVRRKAFRHKPTLVTATSGALNTALINECIVSVCQLLPHSGWKTLHYQLQLTTNLNFGLVPLCKHTHTH